MSLGSRLIACCKLAPTLARQMWRHNYVIDRNEYLISTLSGSTFPWVYSLQFLFKSTNNPWRCERKCEWVFFSEHSVYNYVCNVQFLEQCHHCICQHWKFILILSSYRTSGYFKIGLITISRPRNNRSPVVNGITLFLCLTYSVSQKNPTLRFLTFFPNWWEFVNQFLRTYYTFFSTLDYKFLFNYLQLWRSYAILSATTQRIFTFH